MRLVTRSTKLRSEAYQQPTTRRRATVADTYGAGLPVDKARSRRVEWPETVRYGRRFDDRRPILVFAIR